MAKIKQEVKPNTAHSKIEFIKKVLGQKIGFLDNLTGDLKEEVLKLYETDKDFLLYAISNNVNNDRKEEEISYIVNTINLLDQAVKELGWTKNFTGEKAIVTISAYQGIGALWAMILTPESFLENFQKIQPDIKYLKDRITNSAQNNDYESILPIPHVNRTGSAPIVKINEATGFYTDSTKSKVGGVDLYGVTTKKINNYDSFKKKYAIDIYSHDTAHSDDQGRRKSFFANVVNTENAKMAADLREKSVKHFSNKKDNGYEQKLFELAFFVSFHENGSRVRQDAKEFANLKTITEQIQARIKQSKDITDTAFVKVLFGDDKKVYKASKKELINLVAKVAEENPASIAVLKEKLSSKATMNQQAYSPFLKEMLEFYSTENNADLINIFGKLNNLFKNQGVGAVILYNLINNPASSFNAVKDKTQQQLTNKLIENDQNELYSMNKFHINPGQPIKQYITNILGAKHLGLEVKGDTFSEQVDNFLDLIKQGLDIIEEVHSVELTGSDQT